MNDLFRRQAYFYDLLGFGVLEGYGLTEFSSTGCVTPANCVKPGSVGRAVPGTEIRFASDGEILLRGPALMKGYFNDPIATAEAIDADGWIHTGDVGTMDEEGFVTITDRKKDIIITDVGENIALNPSAASGG